MTRQPSVQVLAFICGQHTIPASTMLATLQGTITIAIPAFVIRHPDGTFVFDTGFNALAHRDVSQYYPEPELSKKVFHFTEDDELARQMARAGVDPDSVGMLANSHLHYDHCGGNAQFPNASILVQRAEWGAAIAAPSDSSGYRRVDFDTGQKFHLLDGQHDVFGDGSVELFPTPGHTAGHQSLRVKTGGRSHIFAADACYMMETLLKGSLPAYTAADQSRLLQSLNELQAAHGVGETVYPGHDPGFWQAQALAPERLFPTDG